MSNREKESFISGAAARPPGKRQVRPTAALFEGDVMIEDDEDDEDFQERSTRDESRSRSSISSSDGSDAEGESSDASDEGTGGDDEGLPSTSKMDAVSGKNEVHNKLLCAVCLKHRHAGSDDSELIKCDRCALAVHETCYAVADDDSESESSSSSTEPWFCEPCTFGMSQPPPHCELCPSRYGAFKRADVGGGWVHLVCALYTHGMSFADVDRLTGASWQELDYRLFGRKPCSACSDPLEARTGIVTQCEAGMCRHYYHITCAQRLGLLSDLSLSTEIGDQHSHQQQQPHSSRHATIHPNHYHHNKYLLCKKHSPSDVLATKREAYAAFLQQEDRRMATFRILSHLTERQESKRQRQLQIYMSRMKKLEGVYIALPTVRMTGILGDLQHWAEEFIQEKKSRMLQTSAQFLAAFAQKAELLGMDRKEFNERFMEIPPQHLPHNTPPAFTTSFARYFHYRDDVLLPGQTRRLAKLREERDHLIERQRSLETQVKTMQFTLSAKHGAEILNGLPEVMISRVEEVLLKLGIGVPQAKQGRQSPMSKTPRRKSSLSGAFAPSTASGSPKKPDSDGVKCPPARRRPNILKRGVGPGRPITPMKQPPLPESHELGKTTSDDGSPPPLLRRANGGPIVLNGINEAFHHGIRTCDKCKKTSDQHLMVFCSTCRKHYHLGCLDPPLKRMPILRKAETFECADCFCPSSSEDDNGSDEELRRQIKVTRPRASTTPPPHLLQVETVSGSTIASRRKGVKRTASIRLPYLTDYNC